MFAICIDLIRFSLSEAMTSTTTSASLRYQCMQTSGALLLLRENAHKWFLDCDRHIKSYMAVHIEQWHEFATMRLGIDVKQEDIIFVSGCTKTSVWAEATFNGNAGQITHRLCHEEAAVSILPPS